MDGKANENISPRFIQVYELFVLENPYCNGNRFIERKSLAFGYDLEEKHQRPFGDLSSSKKSAFANFIAFEAILQWRK